MPQKLLSHADRMRKTREKLRPSAAKRGYDRRWQKFRLWYLRRHPICELCEMAPATEVHHVRGLSEHPEDKYDEQQVQAACKPCHSRETARKAFGAGGGL